MVTNLTAIAQAYADLAAADLLDLDALQAAAVAKVATGGGQLAFTINGAQNGKSAAQECRYDANDLLVIINLAKSLPASGDGEFVSLTYGDFSSLA